MTHDRELIKFFLPSRYFVQTRTAHNNNAMRRETCVRVLREAFGQVPDRLGQPIGWATVMSQHNEGFSIVCTPAQFGYFIMYRYDADECINGIKDLRPEPYKHEDVYDQLANQFSVPKCTVKGLARALGYHNGDESHCVKPTCNIVDVSDTRDCR